MGAPYALALSQGLVGGGITGGVPPYTWTVAGGSSLPPGLTILPGANGVGSYLGGIPTTPGLYTYTLQATDSAGQIALVQQSTNVSALSVSPRVFPNLAAGTAYNVPITVSGGTAPYNFDSVDPIIVPAGLDMIAPSNIAGTPAFPGLYDLKLRVADSSSPCHEDGRRAALGRPSPIRTARLPASASTRAIPFRSHTFAPRLRPTRFRLTYSPPADLLPSPRW